MTSATGLAEFQINSEVAGKTPESTPQTPAVEHNRKPLGMIKGLFTRNSEARDQAQEIQLGTALINQIRVFDKAVAMLKIVGKPEFAGGIVAGAMGGLGMITGSEVLSQLALMTGGLVVGAGLGKSPKERIIGAFVGAAAGAGAIEVVNNIPANHAAIAAGLSVADDALPLTVGIGGIVANAVREKKSQPVKVPV